MAGHRKVTTFCPPDLQRVTWRPAARRGPVCRYTFRSVTCSRRGAHYCQPRADKVVVFFAEYLLHTKGPWARHPFVLDPWEEWEIIRPLFGEAIWDPELERYCRRYRLGYIVLARKNGKSELAAGINLYLLLADDEESAEVFSGAKDSEQATMVFGPALRMVQLNPKLAKLCQHIKNTRRLIVESSSSVYRVLTADAAGELGHNPHGFNLDEVLALPDDALWTTMTTAVGARAQELIYATTTETNKPNSFGSKLIDHAEKVQENPALEPHVFSFVRKLPSTQEDLDRLRRLFPGHPDLPVSIDPFDERNWKWPNPALDVFKSRESMRRQAIEARDDLSKQAAFCQFSVNQRQQTAHRYISMDLWQQNVGELALTQVHAEELADREPGQCWAGLDLSSKLDLTSWCLLWDTGLVLWRHWVPESVVPSLVEATGGVFAEWVRDGWVTPTEGDTIDYDLIEKTIQADFARWSLTDGAFDKWSGEPVRQRIYNETGMSLFESGTTYQQMTGPMTETMRLLKNREVRHLGNPVAAWMADSLQAKHPADDVDRIRPVKPDRASSGVRIDGVVALFFAVDARSMAQTTPMSAYEQGAVVSLA